MDDLTGFQRDLLYVIASFDEPHGLALRDELETYYERDIQHGRLYPALEKLITKDLIEKGEQDRRTNFYALTPRGQRELTAHAEWKAKYRK
jgi:PadR family transcriptional regulator PadR